MIENDFEFVITYHQRCDLYESYQTLLDIENRTILLQAKIDGLKSVIDELTEDLDTYSKKRFPQPVPFSETSIMDIGNKETH